MLGSDVPTDESSGVHVCPTVAPKLAVHTLAVMTPLLAAVIALTVASSVGSLVDVML